MQTTTIRHFCFNEQIRSKLDQKIILLFKIKDYEYKNFILY